MTTNGHRWPVDQIERRAVADLLPYARNAKIHGDEQIELLARAIEKFGWTYPVLIDEAGVIVAGHGRVLAAQRLKLDQVPVMVARGWSPEMVQAYRLLDNKLPELAAWDGQLLAIEFSELQSFNGGELLSLTGF